MASLKKFDIPNEIVDILKQGHIEGNVYYLPDITLSRELYVNVNKVLTALGAKWNKKTKGHIFEYDISEQLENVINTNKVVDWKKETEFFYTPKNVVLEMLNNLNIDYNSKSVVLEPSAGQGHILDILKENYPLVELKCVEQNINHCSKLKEKGYDPINEDFLNVQSFEVDYILMNPPFGEQIKHIKHAYDFLKDNGILLSVVSNNIFDKSAKQNKEFKEWFFSLGGKEYNLPKNSFKETGTMVGTKILILKK